MLAWCSTLQDGGQKKSKGKRSSALKQSHKSNPSSSGSPRVADKPIIVMAAGFLVAITVTAAAVLAAVVLAAAAAVLAATSASPQTMKANADPTA